MSSKKRKSSATDLLAGKTVKSPKVFYPLNPSFRLTPQEDLSHWQAVSGHDRICNCRKFFSLSNCLLQAYHGKLLERASRQSHCRLTAKRYRPFAHIRRVSKTCKSCSCMNADVMLQAHINISHAR